MKWCCRAQRKTVLCCGHASSPLNASGSRRLANAAPQQIFRRVHAGSETFSSGGPRPPLLSRTRQHEKKATIRGSCFVAVAARTLAWTGWHLDPTPPRDATGTSCGDLLADKFRELFLEKEDRCHGAIFTEIALPSLSLPRHLWPLHL